MKKNFLLYVFAFCFIKALSQNVPSYIPSIGLISYWGFDGDANDYKGSNNGVVVNAVLTSDRFGTLAKAYSFNGTNSRIIVPNSTNLSNFNSISISGWFSATAFLSDQGLVTKWFQQVNCANSTDNYSCLLSNNVFTNNLPSIVGATNNYTGYGLKSTFFLQQNVWYHFAFVNDSLTGGKLYINGVLTGQINTQGSICASTNPLIIGADNNLNTISRFFSGKLDDIGIWNRVLTANEISIIYQQGLLNVDYFLPNNFMVFPNPVENKLNVKNSNQALNTKYAIIDLTGREILSGTLKDELSTIEVNSLSKGSYILVLKSGLSKSFKFIKN